MRRRIAVAVPGLFATAGAALANPDGAPWGSAVPGAAEACVSCNFDHEPVAGSAAVALVGLPQNLAPGAVYDLVLAFSKPAPAVGFSAASIMDGAPAGTFIASMDNLEAQGAEIRSAAPARVEDVAVWTMRWRAPDAVAGDVAFYIAVNASNDDQSPFGDEIHLRSFSILPQ